MSDIDAPFAIAQRDLPMVRPRSEPQEAPFARGSLPMALRQHFEPIGARAAESFTDYLQAGFQQSVVGLASRGKTPDIQITEETPWYGRAASGFSGIAGDLPAMVAGFFAGAPVGSAVGGAVGTAVPVVGNVAGAAGGAVVGGFAGAGALPAGLRAAMMEMYTKGEVQSASDFVGRALHVAWETAKGGVVGAATGGAGVAAKAALPVAAPLTARILAPTAAEVATMTTVGRALEGQLPEPQDFLDAAIVLGGMKAAGHVPAKLRQIYALTGKTPAEVIADASRDPSIREDLLQTEGPSASTVPPRGGVLGGPEAKTEPAIVATIKSAEADLGGIPRAYLPLAEAETARSIVPGEKAAAVAVSPFAEVPQVKGEPAKPTHINYNYLNSTEDAKLALSRLSQVYEQEIQTQRRGTVSWEETSNEAAKILSDTLGGVDTKLLMPREPGTPAGAAEIIARKQMTIGAAEAMMAARDNLLAKGAEASPQDQVAFLASIERASMIQSEFLGARAEAGRALNILKSTAMDAERVRMIQDVISMYGGKPMELAEMLKKIDSPAGALKFAREAVKATTWEKVVEAWKAGILSGPVTHVANVLGNTTFIALRAPIDVAAAVIGSMRGGAEKVSFAEPLMRVGGALQGTMDGLKLAAAVMKTGEEPGKSEQFRPAIEGTKGQVIRLPFRFLSAEDAIFRTMNERGELYSQAANTAAREGLNPATREFRERIAQLVETPTAEMLIASKEAGERFTFNRPLGEKGRAVQEFVRKWHLEWAVPFIRTPGNIFKELTRMTPLAPLIKDWRIDFEKGGAARDKALAEVAVGTSIMSAVFMHALNGNISGAGDSDPGKRRVQMAAGWQPYSVKIGDTWYNYQRLQPLGTLIGMAADVANVWDHLTEEESDKTPKMLSVAFANAVTNQTFLQGITNIVNAMSDPTRFGPKLVQQFAGSAIPAIVAQPTQMLDPVAREVDSVLDAVRARLPGLRTELYPKRDVFGEPIKNKERLGVVSPVTETTESTDKVRQEAARLGVSAADIPKKVHIGKGSGKAGDVKLEPGERDVFGDVSGHLAHDILSQVVNSPGWDDLPPLVQKRAFAQVFSKSHRAGAAAALPIAKRLALADEITQKLTTELSTEPQ